VASKVGGSVGQEGSRSKALTTSDEGGLAESWYKSLV